MITSRVGSFDARTIIVRALLSSDDCFIVISCVVDYASVCLNTLIASKRTIRCPDWVTIAGKKTR